MDFTFGIISNGSDVEEIIKSIYELEIPNFEIIIVGNVTYESQLNIKKLEFDENQKSGWITRKKNMICENASYENIVLLHDYFIFDKDWYKGFLKFGNEWEWCICKVNNSDGTRFRDYLLFPYYPWWNVIDFNPFNKCLLPYNLENNKKLTKFMYISGGIYIIKKNIALKFPLDEKLAHLQGEDVNLSYRLANEGIIIKCNQYSLIKSLKFKEQANYFKNELNEIECEELLKKLNSISDDFFLQKLEYHPYGI